MVPLKVMIIDVPVGQREVNVKDKYHTIGY